MANPGDDGRPVYGTDVIVPTGGDGSASMASVVFLQSLISALARLRSEADKWRAIAEERGRVLARREAALPPGEVALPPGEAARPSAPEPTAWYARVYGR